MVSMCLWLLYIGWRKVVLVWDRIWVESYTTVLRMLACKSRVHPCQHLWIELSLSWVVLFMYQWTKIDLEYFMHGTHLPTVSVSLRSLHVARDVGVSSSWYDLITGSETEASFQHYYWNTHKSHCSQWHSTAGLNTFSWEVLRCVLVCMVCLTPVRLKLLSSAD